MHELMKLKDMLCEELEKYGAKGELSSGSLEVVDKLAHAVKSLCVIIDMCEDEEYSSRGGSYGRGGSYNMGGGSYARGGRGGRGGRRGGANQYGSYANGGYSREGGAEELVDAVRGMMQDLPPEIQHEANKFVQKLEQM